jgi:hypothetical protein
MSNTDVYAWNEENMLDHFGKTTEPGCSLTTILLENIQDDDLMAGYIPLHFIYGVCSHLMQ